MWPNFKQKMNYKQKVRNIGLITLKDRRLRGDLIQLYKWSNGIERVALDSISKFKVNSITRGHQRRFNRENLIKSVAIVPGTISSSIEPQKIGIIFQLKQLQLRL